MIHVKASHPPGARTSECFGVRYEEGVVAGSAAAENAAEAGLLRVLFKLAEIQQLQDLRHRLDAVRQQQRVDRVNHAVSAHHVTIHRHVTVDQEAIVDVTGQGQRLTFKATVGEVAEYGGRAEVVLDHVVFQQRCKTDAETTQT